MSELLEAQNRVIIALLARSTFGIKHIEKVVTGNEKKGKASAYVNAYNALDGKKTATEIAEMIGVSKQSVSQVFQTWEKEGIIYKAGEKYVGLLKLESKPVSVETAAEQFTYFRPA